MFGRKARAVALLESDIASVRRQADGWYQDWVVASEKLKEANKKLVVEIEARIAAEDANEILASLLTEIVKEKRAKKKGK